MSNEPIINKKSVWTDTRGTAEHFNLKPTTIRKQRSRQVKNQLPFTRSEGRSDTNIIECEKSVEANKYAYD